MTNTTEELNAAETSIQKHRAAAAEVARAYAPHNEELRLRLLDYLEKAGLSRGDLAREMGVGATQVIKYLNGKADWNLTKFEHIAEGVLATAEKRALYRADLFPTTVTRQINSWCEKIRKTDDFGLIHGAAGWGKTSGISLYTAEYASAVRLEVQRWSRCPADQVRLLWEAAGANNGAGAAPYGETRATWLVKRFEGSHRPILIDNLHRLTKGALQFWFDFHDATGVPIVGFGNPEVMRLIEKNDQMHSRLGVIHLVELPEKEHLTVAQKLIAQVLRERVEDLEELAQEVIGCKGHLRTLRKQLNLAREIREDSRTAGRLMDWRTSFRGAGLKLIRQEAARSGAAAVKDSD